MGVTSYVPLAVLAAVLALLVWGRVHRTTVALGGAVTVLGLRLITQQQAIESVPWEALGLIFGMLILVAALSKSGFFEWVGLVVVRSAGYHPFKILLALAGLSALLSALMDSITVMIFMASLTLEVARAMGVSPIPLLIAEVTSANIGGAATMVGDPPNVIIGTSLGLGFLDFAAHTAPIAIVAFAANLALFYVPVRREFRKAHPREVMEARHAGLAAHSSVKDLRLLRIALAVFAFTVTLLVLHQVLDLLVAFVAVLGAVLVLALGGRDMPDLVEKIDWHTLVFLGALFIVVGSVEASGVLHEVAAALGAAGAGNVAVLLTLVLWTVALASALLDNVPLSAAMIPVIRDLAAATGIPVTTLAWTLALGADFGGNATPIGASANVVGLAVAEKHGVHVGWREYMRFGVPSAIVSVAIANVLLLVLFAR
ncbi:MAG TPA: ArsB/NhaD family transporter [Thermoplasmata archaeon]|nr:ArsB/NhaD family transporter [Thermoplasmata archaeon]